MTTTISKQDFKKYQGFCRYHAGRFFNYRSFEFDEAVLEGLYGVSKAIKSYNPDNPEGASLNSYITTCVKNNISQYHSYVRRKKIEGVSIDFNRFEYGMDIVSYDDFTENKIDVEKKLIVISNYITDTRNKIKKFRYNKSPRKAEMIKNQTYERMLYVYDELIVKERKATELAEELGISHQAISMYKTRMISDLKRRMKNAGYNNEN